MDKNINIKEFKNNSNFIVTSELEIPLYHIHNLILPMQYISKFFFFFKKKEYSDLGISFLLMKEKSSIMSNLMDYKNIKFNINLLDGEGKNCGTINILTDYCSNYYISQGLSYSRSEILILNTEWKVKDIEIDI